MGIVTTYSIFQETIAQGGVGINTSSPDRMLDVENNSGVPQLRLTFDGSNFVDLESNSAGNLLLSPSGLRVGIGISLPLEALHINGNIRGGSTGGSLRISTGNGILDIGPQNTAWSHFSTDRTKFYFNKEIHVDGGFVGSYNTANLTLHTGGTTRVTVLNSNGNVGIGSASPANKLDVVGNVLINGNLIIPTTYDITLTDLPTLGTDAANKAYVDAQVGGAGCNLTWKGYTTTPYNGSMGGIQGMNDKCNTFSAGSHACLFNEIVTLGASYPWSSNAWVIDGAVTFYDGTTLHQLPKGGGVGNSLSAALPMCQGWTSSNSTRRGPYTTNTGILSIAACNANSLKIPCCKCE